MTASYDYLFLTLGSVPAPHQALAERLTPSPQLVGQFAPQLGWATNEAALLVRGGAEDLIARLSPPLVASFRRDRLKPTIRPADEDQPMPGGVYVHRWFEIAASAGDEFVKLSGQGWEHFEARFDTRIFGLFRVEQTGADRAAGVMRLLLLTRYRDHGVWEESRDPSTEAMQIFARRQQLTRRSWAASSRLLA